MEFVPDYSGGPVPDLHRVPFSSTEVEPKIRSQHILKNQRGINVIRNFRQVLTPQHIPFFLSRDPYLISSF